MLKLVLQELFVAIMGTDNAMIVYVMFDYMVMQDIIWKRMKQLQKLQHLPQLQFFLPLFEHVTITLT
jgi:hypothetical protein